MQDVRSRTESARGARDRWLRVLRALISRAFSILIIGFVCLALARPSLPKYRTLPFLVGIAATARLLFFSTTPMKGA